MEHESDCTREEGELTDDEDVPICDNDNAVSNSKLLQGQAQPQAESHSQSAGVGAAIKPKVDIVVENAALKWFVGPSPSLKFGHYSNFRGLEVYDNSYDMNIAKSGKRKSSFSDNMREKLRCYSGRHGRGRVNQIPRNRLPVTGGGVDCEELLPGTKWNNSRYANEDIQALTSFDAPNRTALGLPLSANPPPPPPPPPPPLPSSPPPSPPPPPPPLSLPKRRTSGPTHNRRKSASRFRRAISPTGDIEDTDYIDLLLEYKQIQQQLQSIRQQEKKVARLSGHGGGHAGGHTGAGQARRRSYSARKPVEQTGVAGRPIEISDSDNAPGDDANKGDGTVHKPLDDRTNDPEIVGASACLSNVTKSQSAGSAKSPLPSKTGSSESLKSAEDDEELEVMELRLAALASVAKETHRTPSDDRGPASSAGRRASNHRRVPLRQRARRYSERSPPGGSRGTRRRPSADRRRDDDVVRGRRSNSRDERRQEDLRRERSRILALDDPDEQLRRFLQLTVAPSSVTAAKLDAGKNSRDRVRTPSGGAVKDVRTAEGMETRPEHAPPVVDNYDQVEMDIDSGCSSPASGGTLAAVTALLLDAESGPVEEAPCAPQTAQPVTDGALGGRQEATAWDGSANVSAGAMTSADRSPTRYLAVSEKSDPQPSWSGSSSPRTFVSATPPPTDASRVGTASGSPSGDASPAPRGGDDGDDDEEATLRAQLLKSMARRRREKGAVPEQLSSSPLNSPLEKPQSIPVVSRSKQPAKPKTKVLTMPVHKRVVIALGEDSSESEAETPAVAPSTAALTFHSSLDMFLKEARKSSEAVNLPASAADSVGRDAAPAPGGVTPAGGGQTAGSGGAEGVGKATAAAGGKSGKASTGRHAEQERKVKLIAEKIKQERQLIGRYDGVLADLEKQLKLRRLAHRSAEQKAQKLWEQLAAAERIVKAHAQPIDKLTQRISVLGGQLNGKQQRLTELEGGLEKLEKKLFGKVMNLSGARKTPAMMKRKPAAVRERTVVRKAAISPQVLANEKQRLQRLERCYADMIEQFKRTQQRGEAGGADTRTVTRRDPSTPTHIVTEERMTFSEVGDEVTTSVPQRRRSLIDASASSIPNLPNSQATAATADAQDSGGKAAGKRDSVAIPTGQQLNNLRRLHKENISQLMPFANICPPNKRSPFNASFQVVNGATASLLVKADPSPVGPQHTGPLKAYRSELLKFRSYRLSPYYRTKERRGIGSLTCSHRVRANLMFCRFELTGKCNDDKCPWQHFRDIQPSSVEMLAELISYSPGIAGISPDTPSDNCAKLVDEFVEKFSQLSGRMSHDQQCVLLTSRVNDHAKRAPPHVMLTEARTWRPLQRTKTDDGGRRNTVELTVFKQIAKPASRWRLSRWEEDNVVGEGDVRYWALGDGGSGGSLPDMEAAVLARPNDTQLWLQLAYRKLQTPAGSSERNLEHALNVLSRALEVNRFSSAIWLHYLRLYGRRSDSSDLPRLYRQALQYAPSYALYWKCVDCLTGFTLRHRLCVRLLAWLISDLTPPPAVRSHRLLEALLYQLTLNVHTGRYANALQLFKVALTDRASPAHLASHLTPDDRLLAWLAYIHLAEFQHLPPSLFDATDNNPGRLVSKEPWLLPWPVNPRTEVDTLVGMLREAECDCRSPEGGTENDDGDVTLPIHRNLVRLYAVTGRFEEAEKTCRVFLSSSPRAVPRWVNLAELHMTHGHTDTAKAVLYEALSHNPSSAHLYNLIANLALIMGEVDDALESLEECAISFFHISNLDLCDPNQLYSELLASSSGLGVKSSFPHKQTSEFVSSQQLYLWLNYCLLLELQGELVLAVEAYETALSSFRETVDVQAVWRSYLQCLYRGARDAAAAAPVAGAGAAGAGALAGATRRCLATMPCRVGLPHDAAARHRLAYDFHDGVVDAYVQTLAPAERTAAYETFCRLMPANVTLAQRACAHAYHQGDVSLARGLCLTAINEHPRNVQLWRTNLFLAYEQASYAEIHKIYDQATSHLPYMLTLWKDYVLFEMAHSSVAGVQHISQQCRRLSLNIGNFITALLK